MVEVCLFPETKSTGGVFAGEGDRHWYRSLVGGVAMALLIVASAGFISYRSSLQSDMERRWVSHTHLVVESLGDFVTSVDDADAARNAFSWKGDENLLLQYRRDMERSAAQVAELRRLTADNPTQQRALDQLQIDLRDFEKQTGDVVARQNANPRTARGQLRGRASWNS